MTHPAFGPARGGAVDPWTPLSSVSLGILIDNARECVMVERRAGREPDAINVSPEVYDILSYIRRAELDAGLPLGLLGKRVKMNRALHQEDVTIEPISVGG
ncbi:hypothetical protein JL108_08905 [Aeromicrobium sp. YIM 150415]|uniref:hypothetical protein n=1 Tax=Aeromicrobium sp. YIM 150415 TaxID=2803912 RepID=UPI001966CBED|nr:hypothetical protein [Aeromicrobium sp. YIM 150415]MBM9463569.1 hypothetical protein [Aeromicrobium sp. YIM 150415]